jgi:hypothetical protein
LVEALSAFFNSGLKLKPFGKKYAGLLLWWKCRNISQSSNVDSYTGGDALGGITFEDESTNDSTSSSQNENATSKDPNINNGVVLGASNAGNCAGVIKLPKLALWNIVLTVSRNKASLNDESGDEHDYCSVRLGPSFASLQTIGFYYNKINPDTGAILYDVKFLLRGDRLAFKFDFLSSTTDVSKVMSTKQII